MYEQAFKSDQTKSRERQDGQTVNDNGNKVDVLPHFSNFQE